MEQNIQQAPMHTSLMGAWDTIKTSFALYKKNIQSIALIISLPVVLYVMGAFFTPIYFLGVVAGIFSYAALGVLLLAPEKSASSSVIDYYKKGLVYVIPFIWVNILATLATAGGVLLLVVPGIIVGVFLAFARFGIIIEEKRGMDALVTSYHYVQGRWWALVGRALLFALILVIIGTLVGFVGGLFSPGGFSNEQFVNGQAVDSYSVEEVLSNLLNYFVFVPLGIVFGGVLYRDFQKSPAHVMTPEEDKRIRNVLQILMVIGVVAFIALAVFGMWFIQQVFEGGFGFPGGSGTYNQ